MFTNCVVVHFFLRHSVDCRCRFIVYRGRKSRD